MVGQQLIPRTREFTLLALPIGFEDRFPAELPYSTTASLTRTFPLSLEDHWRTWLGSLLVDELHKAGCYFVFHSRAIGAPPLAEVIPDLNSRHFHIGLLLALKHASHKRGIRLAGGHDLSDPSVRHFGIVDPVVPLEGAPWSRIGIKAVAEADRIATSLALVDGTDGYRRLRAALRIYQEGLRAQMRQVRLHQFVRAFEAVAPLGKGSGKAAFRTRTADLLGDDAIDLADLLFDLRSAEEHLNLLLPNVPGSTDAERIVGLTRSAYQSQLLARETLRRVLLTPELLHHFRDDQAQLAFWDLPVETRRDLWGPPMTMSSESADLDVSRIQLTG